MRIARVFTLFAVLGVCSITVNGQDSTRVEGRAIDAQTKEPVSGALVWTTDSLFTATGGEDGSFQLTLEVNSPQLLQVRAPGYLPASSDTLSLLPGVISDVVVTLSADPKGPIAARRRLLPRIEEIVGTRTLKLGEMETYRARLSASAERPVEFYWDFGDGTYADGNPVVHVFEQAGTMVVSVEARNRIGTLRDTLFVEVLGQPEAPADATQRDRREAEIRRASEADEDDSASSEAPAAEARRPPARGLRGALAISMAEGGYSWMVRTSFVRSDAEQLVRSLRADGLRSGVYVDNEGEGATVYRVVVGQFPDEESAERARGEVLELATGVAILWWIPPNAQQ